MSGLNYQEIASTKQRFCIKGNNPTILIVSGTHGDEYEIVPFVEKAVIKYENQLSDFLYIPEVSPSAVSLKTRKNKEGLDINRSFFKEVESEEVLQMMQLWSKYKFDLFLTIHEDPAQDSFYLYDGMKAEYFNQLKLEGSPEFDSLRKDILNLGINLYTGTDDAADPHLSYQVLNGYAHWPMIHNDHSSDYWLLVEKEIAKHVINPEIPGKISPDKKREIVHAIFKRILLKKN